MVPFAVAGVEYGALASRGGFARATADLVDAITSPDLETVAWIAAAIAVVLLATRRRGRVVFALLLVVAAALTARWLDLP